MNLMWIAKRRDGPAKPMNEVIARARYQDSGFTVLHAGSIIMTNAVTCRLCNSCADGKLRARLATPDSESIRDYLFVVKYLYLRFEFLYLGFNTFLFPRLVGRRIETMWKMSFVVSYCTFNLLL
jgi:hypothetical protein